MATKTFEELKQLAIQIRDEKTNKQNTATRVGTAMLEHINKLEQDYYDKTQTDEELKEQNEKLTGLSNGQGIYNRSILLNFSFSGNGYINQTTGNTSSISGVFYSDFIPVEEGVIITFNRIFGNGLSGVASIACYDAEKQYLVDESITGRYDGQIKLKINSSVKYVRFTFRNVEGEYIVLSGITNNLLNEYNDIKLQYTKIGTTIKPSALLYGYYVELNTGQFKKRGNGYDISEKIYVKGATSVNIAGVATGGTFGSISLYNSKDEIVYSSNLSGLHSVPEDAVYAYMSMAGSNTYIDILFKEQNLCNSFLSNKIQYDLSEKEKIDVNKVDKFFSELKEYYKKEDLEYSSASDQRGYISEFKVNVIIKKIHLFAANTSTNIYLVGSDGTKTPIYSFSDLTIGEWNVLDVDIYLKPRENIEFEGGSIYYIRDGSSYFMCGLTSGFVGYLSYWIEYVTLEFPELTNINKSLDYNLSYKANSVSVKSWNIDSDTSGIISSSAELSISEKGILIGNDIIEFLDSRLSIETLHLTMTVDKTSEFQICSNAGCTKPGVKISFASNLLTDLQNTEKTKVLDDFISGETEITIDLIVNNNSSKLILSNNKTSKTVEFDLECPLIISQRDFTIKNISGSSYIKHYELIFPTDIDVIFSGDSITEGVGITGEGKTYAFLYQEATGLKVATFARGYAVLDLGITCANLCAQLRPKFISIMYGMNSGNTISRYKEIQNKCDEYHVPVIFQRMPMSSSIDKYNTNVGITEKFVNDFAHIKYSAKFDVATALNGNPSDGYNSELTDGTHPNNEGHIRMFNRLRIDVPIMNQ